MILSLITFVKQSGRKAFVIYQRSILFKLKKVVYRKYVRTQMPDFQSHWAPVSLDLSHTNCCNDDKTLSDEMKYLELEGNERLLFVHPYQLLFHRCMSQCPKHLLFKLGACPNFV